MMTNNELLEKISQIITGQKKERITITSAYANLKKYVEINCRPDTVLFYDKYYNSSIVYFSKFKINYLDELNVPNVSKIVGELKTKDLSNNTINKYITLFKYLVKYNYEIEQISTNQLTNFKKLKADVVETPTIPNEVIEQVFAYLDSLNKESFHDLRVNVVVRLLRDTGMRTNELFNLKVSEINLEEKRIRLTYTKTGKPRFVYFTESTKEYLALYISKLTDTAYLLNLKEHRIAKRTIGKILTNIEHKLKLNCSISPHKWRHTLASTLLDNGMNLKSVQKILGHFNISVTNKYLHTSENSDQNQFINIFENKCKNI